MVLDVLAHGFIQKALISGIAVATICSFMGTFLVLRRYALFGDGTAHVAFGGIAIGMASGIFPIWTAYLTAILGGLGLQKLRQSTKMSGDAGVAIILVGGLSVGVLVISATGGFSVDLFSFLFGSILLISAEETIIICSFSAGIVITLVALRNQFLHLTFNEAQAKLAGLNVTLLNYVFVVLAAITVVTSMRLVGILLISALVVIPSITATTLGKSFWRTILLSITFSISSVVVGVFLSYYLDLAPSGTIVVISLTIFVSVMLIRKIIQRQQATAKPVAA